MLPTGAIGSTPVGIPVSANDPTLQTISTALKSAKQKEKASHETVGVRKLESAA